MPSFPVDPGSMAYVRRWQHAWHAGFGWSRLLCELCRIDWPISGNDGLLDVQHLYGAKHLCAALQFAQAAAASAERSHLQAFVGQWLALHITAVDPKSCKIAGDSLQLSSSGHWASQNTQQPAAGHSRHLCRGPPQSAAA